MIDSPNAPSNHQAQDSPESLFGSPPPSPVIKGRSPSPLLALPGSSSSVGICRVSTQNVGTIALPGSHLDSELPINPLALSLSYSPRPPAQDQVFSAPSNWRHPNHASTFAFATATSSAISSSSSTPVSSRSSSLAPNLTSTTKKKKILKRKTTTYERPPPPEIPLPDPSGPPPSNFLRSQNALLGTAGLVAGVKPSTITHKDTRGMTSNNPIVIDDNPPPPQPVSKPLLSLFLAMNSLGLSHPSNQEIVRILVRQKAIFPLLEEILKLIASGSIRPSPSWRRDYQPGSTKRRKLRHVPAGANDWDVPYPFARGEGPEEYDANWAKERCKQLVSQLVGLIKTATRKAALKSYLQQLKLKEAVSPQHTLQDSKSCTPEPPCKAEEESSLIRVAAHNALSASSHPTDESPPAVDVTYIEHTALPTTAVHAVPSSSLLDAADFSQNATVDQLLESLLAVSSSDALTSDSSSTSSSDAFPDSSGANQQWLFDNWMSIFESFPVPESGLADLPPFSPRTENSLPFSPLPDLPVDFGNLEILETAPETGVASATELWGDAFDVTTPVTVPLDTESSTNVLRGKGTHGCESTVPTEDVSFTSEASSLIHASQIHYPPHDSVIDPVLLAHARPLCTNTFLDIDAGPPSLVSSPMPSMSSMGDLELLTPSSSAWEINLPDVASVSGSEDGLSGSVRIPDANPDPSQGMLRRAIRNNVLAHLRFGNKGVSFDPETRKSVEKEADVRNVLPMLVSSVLPSCRVDTPSFASPPASAPDLEAHLTPRAVSREQLLRQAHTRRAQIADAIVKARTALWETTIEGGVLAHLARYYKT
ncbi:hypothetical protein IW262DRAFT_1544552 [Armillaria fumosa]|nr:hypothetical protein IW262DRAFT_1544552 [Armillaria fumosa]